VIEAWSSPDSLERCGWLNPPAPKRDDTVDDPNSNPSSIYNGMVHPLLNLTIKGVIWYQGESNVGPESAALNYSCTFPAMIQDWRKKFSRVNGTSDPIFPFGFVQLSGYCNCCCIGGDPNGCDGNYVAMLRWAQTANKGDVPNAALPNVFMAVSIDASDPNSPSCDVHPRFKQQVGQRLADGALAIAYGAPTHYQGPYPQDFSVTTSTAETASLVVNYLHALVQLELQNNTQITGFEAGYTSGNFYACVVSAISSSQVQLMCPPGQIVALRYAWRNDPCIVKSTTGWEPSPCLLYNSAGLPASPFYLSVQALINA